MTPDMTHDMNEPEKPRGVRLRYPDGREIPIVRLDYIGTVDLPHTWLGYAQADAALTPGACEIVCDYLPPQAAVLFGGRGRGERVGWLRIG